MSAENVYQRVREALNGRPGQPIVFGVCTALAARLGCEVWITRLIALVSCLFSLPAAVIAYIILGLALDETAVRARGFFSGLGVIAREQAEKIVAALRGAFGQAQNHG